MSDPFSISRPRATYATTDEFRFEPNNIRPRVPIGCIFIYLDVSDIFGGTPSVTLSAKLPMPFDEAQRFDGPAWAAITTVSTWVGVIGISNASGDAGIDEVWRIPLPPVLILEVAHADAQNIEYGLAIGWGGAPV